MQRESDGAWMDEGGEYRRTHDNSLNHARCSQPTSKPVIVRMFSGYAVLLSLSRAPILRQIMRG